jgi:hypothetical protein
MKLLPRYTFRTTGEFCPHGDPDCLCDVHISQPTPIRTDVPHMFHELALQELDDYGVTSRNVVEFFSIVVGCHEIYRREVHEEAEHCQVWTNVPSEGKKDSGPSAWRSLPDDVKSALRRHAYASTPWSFAAVEIDGQQLDASGLRAVRKYYNDTRRNNFYTERRRATREVKPCAHCGAEFLPFRGDTKYCSHKCTMASHRARAAEYTRRYRAAKKKEVS